MKRSFLAIVAHAGGDRAANQLREKGLHATLLIIATSRRCRCAATLLRDGVFTAIAKALHVTKHCRENVLLPVRTLANEIVGTTSCRSAVGGEEAAHHCTTAVRPLEYHFRLAALESHGELELHYRRCGREARPLVQRSTLLNPCLQPHRSRPLTKSPVAVKWKISIGVSHHCA